MKRIILLIAFCLSLSVIYAQKYETCKSCEGSGKVHYTEISPCRFCDGKGYDISRCPQCKGRGEIRIQDGQGGYKTVPCNNSGCDDGFINKRCGACGGRGEERCEISRDCRTCDGTGKVKRENN